MPVLRIVAVTAVLAVAACSHASVFRTEEELAQKNRAPSFDRTAQVNRAAPLRAGPSTASPAVGQLQPGAEVAATSESSRGFRRVKTAEGQTGFVEEGAVTVSGVANAPAGAGSAGATSAN